MSEESAAELAGRKSRELKAMSKKQRKAHDKAEEEKKEAVRADASSTFP